MVWVRLLQDRNLLVPDKHPVMTGDHFLRPGAKLGR